MKKLIVILSLIFLLITPFFVFGEVVQDNKTFAENKVLVTSSEDENKKDLEDELSDTIGEQLGSLDFDGLQDVLDGLSSDSLELFGTTSFWDKITRLLSGEFDEGYGTFFHTIIGLMFEEVVGFIPLLAIIVMVTLICSMISNLRSKESEGSVGQVVDFVCFGVVVVLVSSVVIGFLTSSSGLMTSMQTQMNALFPILLTLLAGVGGTMSVGIFQPAVVILSSVVVTVFTTVIIPLFVFQFVLIVVNNLSSSVKLNKFISLISSIFKWLAGICFSVFLGVLAVQGIMAGSFDSVSIKATRFAIKSYVPILGGYLSDGFNMIMASSVLIKNVVGVAGIFLLFASILSPVVQIIVCSLLLKLGAAILEPMTNNSRVPEFLQQIAKLLNLLVMMILGVAFMYIITVGLILCTANVL